MNEATHYFANFLELSSNMTEVSGRLSIQENAEKRMVNDVAKKLRLNQNDSLLEIGCGVGNLIIPLSFMVKHCVGVDHQKLVDHAAGRFRADNIDYIAGQFPDVDIDGHYSKILVYSVLAYMRDEAELLAFIDTALDLLTPDGRLMLGDIPCLGHKERFTNSAQGEAFQKEWAKLREANPGTEMPAPEGDYIEITDDVVMNVLSHCRKRGFHSYITEQDAGLPFGNTREDIVIVAPENTGN